MQPQRIFSLKNFLLAMVIAYSLFLRFEHFGEINKDIYAYTRAIEDLVTGVNPYKYTVLSFNSDDTGNHGYAYLPALMYLQAPLYLFSIASQIPFQYLAKVPVLLADLGIAALIILHFKNKPSYMTILGVAFWLLNPYFYYKVSYVYTDPLAIFFMMLSLHKLSKDSVLSGASYALSVAFKSFPLILLPFMFYYSKDKAKFFVSAAIVGIFLSLPFLTSLNDFAIYLNGSLFVHSNRFVQGRPFLFYISYYYDIEFFQIVPFKVYTNIATFGGWVIGSLIFLLSYKSHYFKSQKIKSLLYSLNNKYMLSLISFLIFYIFNPVLNRTYLLWFMPILLYTSAKFDDMANTNFNFQIMGRNIAVKPLFLLTTVLFYWFYWWYLVQWRDGFHIWRPL